MAFDWSVFVSALFSASLFKGAVIALALTVLAHALAIALSLPMAIALRGTNTTLKAAIKVYVTLFRAVPILLLLLIIWNGLPQLSPIFREQWFTPFLAALIGLALTEAAYQVEINRAALGAIHHGQVDAGNALGFNRLQIFFLIQVPQAMRVALPPTVNEFITLLKATSIASVISLRELMTVTQQAVAFTYKYAEYYLAALIYYVAMVLLLMVVQAFYERRMSWIGR
ncbi:amino acid ABC transporter permease [Microbaculum marinisediminis]|uniref:Amino acid ABC transporter permease n=1 Tax=Microbaculum marinisediminis TaxID=2931392 RepID=A0AAW5QZS1_9HYPH|nr:amino acid ABC transporter permease [Microbaculum sp. A6E488]MCT8972550.1 amino acid ABC transporter permease [Microbaculum sp. A6E488]